MQARLVTTTIVLVLLPPLALLLDGRPIAPHFLLPPAYEYQTGGAFSPLGAAMVGLTAVGLVLLAVWMASRRQSEPPLKPEGAKKRDLPPRGWAGIGLMLLGISAGIVVSAPLSAPLALLGTTLLMDADAWRRTGSSLIDAQPGYVLMLLPTGIALGWGIEYLNRFIEIGYIDPLYGPWGYAVSVSLPSAALFPAVLAARFWLESLAFFSRIRPVSIPGLPAEAVGLTLIGLALAALGAATLSPEVFYLPGWIAPVMLLGGVQQLLGDGPGIGLNGRSLAAMSGGILSGAILTAASLGEAPWLLHSPVAAFPSLGTWVLAVVLFAVYGLTAQQIGDWLAEPWRGKTKPMRRISIPIKGEPKR